MARILIIDDDKHVLRSLSTVLEDAGHTVSTVASLSEFRSNRGILDSQDLVLLDLWLSDGSGLDILESISAKETVLPVIVISGGGAGQTLEQAVAFADMRGARDVLIKPFRNRELLAAINKALADRA